MPVTLDLDRTKHHIIEADLRGGGEWQDYAEKTAEYKFDVERFKGGSFAARRLVLKIAKFLDTDSRIADKKQIDGVVFSEILNYIDFEDILGELFPYIKIGGKVIVFNKPDRGYKSLFSEYGVKNNYQLVDSLPEQEFEIEQLKTLRDADWTYLQQMMFLVARKLSPEDAKEFRHKHPHTGEYLQKSSFLDKMIVWAIS